MKYLFVNPPFYSINPSPIIGIPELLGVLSENGVSSNFIDLNIDYYSELMSKQNLNDFIIFFNNIFKDETYKKLPILLQDILQTCKNNSFDNIKKLIYISSRIDFSTYILKNKSLFFNQVLCEYAYNNINILEKVLSLISNEIVNSFFKEDEQFEINIDNIISFYNSNANQLKEYYDRKIKDIIKKNPDCIGVTINFPAQLISGLYLCLRIKQEIPNAYINIGGSFFTYSYHNIKNLNEILSLFCNSISIRHNTLTVLELIKYLKNEIEIEKISNLIYLKNNEVQVNNQIKSNFTKLPFQCFDGINIKNYLCPNLVLPIRASISCYWRKCIYCYCSGDDGFFIKPVNKVIEEIEYLVKTYNTKYFYFWDNVLHPKYIEKIANLLIEKNLNIKYSIFARFEEDFTYSLLKKLKKSGCVKIHWGLDTTSTSVCEFINKGTNFNTIKKVLKNSHRALISNFVYLLIGQPTETSKDIEEGLNFIKKNKRNIDILMIYTKVLYMRNSIMWQNMEKYKKLIYLSESETLRYKSKFINLFKFNAEELAVYNVVQYSMLYLEKYGVLGVYFSTLFYLFIKKYPKLFNLYIKFFINVFNKHNRMVK
jgi:radical SAM superfamily enzyme YgiQ (UPF0313 family)